MKKITVFILLIGLFLYTHNSAIASTYSTTLTDKDSNLNNVTLRQDLLCLMLAYPEYILNIEGNDQEGIYLLMKSGRKLLYDDKRNKSSDQKLANPDLQDTLEQVYPLSTVRNILDKDFDPGRCRVYGLLTEVYGTSKQSVESKLINVNAGNNHYQFNGNNKAADSLHAVMSELLPLAQGNSTIRNCIFPCSGTFNYRIIAGTNQLSPHSFGIAIDLAVNKGDYWKWSSRETAEKRLSTYPSEIVEAFEKNNFIWGGKWGHFDIMHFEYRPEIVLKARYFKEKQNSEELWYEGAPIQEVSVKNLIEKINLALRK
ncbi:MAG: M15 family metallopeptidase [Clostridiaceae bacterium]|nr:M15 family metallopeptidase [Clostridiaceae bacterium]